MRDLHLSVSRMERGEREASVLLLVSESDNEVVTDLGMVLGGKS